MSERIPSSTARSGAPALTVAELREILSTLADEVLVVLATDDYYVHVGALGIPIDEPMSDYAALTLYPGADLDSRDF